MATTRLIGDWISLKSRQCSSQISNCFPKKIRIKDGTGMILLTGFYHDGDLRRRGELLECIKRNAANEWIGEVRIFIEDATAPETISADEPKVTLIPLGRRLTFRFLFDYANEHLEGQTV